MAALAACAFLGACQDICTEGSTDPDCQIGQEDLDAAHSDLPETSDEFTPEEDLYCRCMLFSCHDPFHDTWGVEDVDAFEACLIEISSVPLAGQETSTGNFQECRLKACQSATPDCDAALGLSVCR